MGHTPGAVPAEPLDEPLEGEDNDMTEDERRELDAIIAESEAEFERGEGIPFETVLTELRRELHGRG